MIFINISIHQGFQQGIWTNACESRLKRLYRKTALKKRKFGNHNLTQYFIPARIYRNSSLVLDWDFPWTSQKLFAIAPLLLLKKFLCFGDAIFEEYDPKVREVSRAKDYLSQRKIQEICSRESAIKFTTTQRNRKQRDKK